MRGLQRTLLAVALVAASFGSTLVVSLLTAQPGVALATCTDNWQGPTSGTQSWGTAANWSTGLPVSTSVACIALNGTYTVDLTGGASINTLELGGTSGTQTLEVSGASGNDALSMAASTASLVGSQGVLSVDPTSSGYAALEAPTTALLTVASGGTLSSAAATGSSPAYIETPVTNQSGGTVTIGAPTTDQDEGTLTTNDGSFTVAGGGKLALTNNSSFTDAAGTLVLTGTMSETSGTFTQSGGTESGQAVGLSGTTLADNAGTGGFNVIGSGSLSGTIPSGQTVTVNGAAGNVALSLPAAVTDHGTLALTPASGYADVSGNGGLTVASGGTLSSAAATGSSPAYIETPVTNQSGGTVTIGAPTTDQDEGTLTTNDGSFTVAGGGKLALTNNSSFTDAAGTLVLTGTMSETSGTFTQSGGTESGQAVGLSGTTLADNAGTGGFNVTGSGSLSGTIPSGQTVTVNGASGNVTLSLSAAVTDHGTLALTPASGYADVSGNGGLTVASGGTVSSAAATGSFPAYIETPVTNQSGGTVTIGAPTTDQDEGTLTTNDGSFTVAGGGKLALTNNSSFTDAAGTLVLTGTMSETSGTFTQSGGTESGQAVGLSGTTLADNAGTGGFNVTGSGSLSGTIPSGQTVTVNGAAGNVALSIPSAVTDDGTLALTPGTGYAQISSGGGVTIASGGVLSTAAAAGSSPAYIETPLTNQLGGTVTVGALDTRQDEGTLTTSAGTFQIVNGGHLTMSDGSTLTTGSGASLAVTVNGTSGSGGISGPGLSLAGTLAVTTVGSPSLGTIFKPISGPVSGTFSSFAFGPDAYTVAYPSNAVQLTTVVPFTMSPTPFSPKENLATGAVELATIGNAAAGTGSYSATVNWGDATATQAATVAITGATGTVTGPSHTYTTSGNYTVTTTLANSDGTTLSTMASVTVTGPTITKFSKTSVKQGKKLTTVVSGTGFTAGVVVTTSNPGITVVSAKLAKVSKKHPVPTLTLKLKASKTAALGPFSVTLSESSGTVTATGAITVLAK